MHVIGTAGHVDHGKSTLVLALTGIDPDRLEEEKRRGLTIDLGFAWLPLPSGGEVGIVDVPGHERFIKNMLAGAGAVNVTLFVVSATEGWKPQSQEHLDILDLLGIRSGVVALTMADLVDEATLLEVAADVEERLAGTSLAGSPILGVSGVTRQGLPELLGELERALARTPPAEDRDRPRLWVDRVFSMKGSGTVVTGTLIGGPLVRNEEVEVLPPGLRARVRGIQSHRRQVERIPPGNRTALNLVGADSELLARGQIVTRPDIWRTIDRIIASIRLLPHLGHDPTERGAFKLYAGSMEVDVGIRFLGELPGQGGTGTALVTLSRPAALEWGDRFVLRDAGRRETVGGGVVLEVAPGRIRRGDASVLERVVRRRSATDRLDYLRLLLEEEGRMARSEIRHRTGLVPADAERLEAVWLPTNVFSKASFDGISQRASAELRRYQQQHPLELGMSRAAVRAVLGLDARSFDEVVEHLAEQGVLVADASAVRTPDHVPDQGGPQRDALLQSLDEAGFSPPPVPELHRLFDPALVRALVRTGELVQVAPDLVYRAAGLQRLKELLAAAIEGSGPVTVAQFRDLVSTTRKYAVPLLEYLDRIGFTRRQGDVRVLGPSAGTAQSA
jgi:selenocysteine-specific elongation factor